MAKTKKKPTKPARVNVETWQDQPHRARPTPERLRHGTWRTRESEIAGMSYAVDEGAHPLDRLVASGKITDDQRQAGLDAAELFARNRMVAEGRSCLNFDPVGHYDDVPDDAASYRCYCDLWHKLGPIRAGIIRNVCMRAEMPRKSQVPTLLDGLAVCELFFSPRVAKGRKVFISDAARGIGNG